MTKQQFIENYDELRDQFQNDCQTLNSLLRQIAECNDSKKSLEMMDTYKFHKDRVDAFLKDFDLYKQDVVFA